MTLIEIMDSVADIIAKLSTPTNKASAGKASGKKKESANDLKAKVEAMVVAYLMKQGDEMNVT